MSLQLLHFQTFTCLTTRTQMPFSFKEDFQRLCLQQENGNQLEVAETELLLVAGITETSEQGLAQSLCLLLLLISSCKNLIKVEMNHSSF